MTRIFSALLLLTLLTPARLCAAEPAPAPAQAAEALHEGDIIFIHSNSSQASAIEEATASDWTHVGVLLFRDKAWQVAEAARTVTLTPLPDFIARSRGGGYSVLRLKAWDAAPDKKALARLTKWLLGEKGKKYDIYFEWSDAAMYCSEYVWKAYNYALRGRPVLSAPQKFSDMNLAGPRAQELFEKRYVAAGRKLNPAEPIVTPVALYNSPLLRQLKQ
ncbi:MAG TPA: YiiX/YebB-like N1pC/P60 family cysteine hydrolase [Elusimicrobiales bacterium]|nr:YiiX/YebB-like N1pC/P60 family cysteine hydrolase [Elusimicrobiales bacterium]